MRDRKTRFRRTEDAEMEIVMRYRNGATLSEVAHDYGITRERIRQIIERWEREHGYEQGAVRADRALIRAHEAITANRRKSIERAEVRAYAHAELLDKLRRFYETHGRPPHAEELGIKGGIPKHPDCPHATALLNAFGSLARAYALAGVPAPPRGTPSHHATGRRGRRGRPGSPGGSPAGEAIRTARLSRGLTMAQLAEAADVSVGSVFQWEKGGEIKLSSLRVLARVLDVPILQLLGDSDPADLNGNRSGE